MSGRASLPKASRDAPDVLVALVFLGAGALKIWDPGTFALAMARLQVVPRGWIGPTAILMPWIEVTAAAALLTPSAWRPAGRTIVAGLLAAFTAVLAVAFLRGNAGSCGCFGTDGGFWSRLDVGLARNFLLGGLLALRAHLGRRPDGHREAPGAPTCGLVR